MSLQIWRRYDADSSGFISAVELKVPFKLTNVFEYEFYIFEVYTCHIKSFFIVLCV